MEVERERRSGKKERWKEWEGERGRVIRQTHTERKQVRTKERSSDKEEMRQKQEKQGENKRQGW